jgi:NAD(P)-dependent dehydrogenase (short-subunit alcohol dehydrogenase family)
MSGPTIATTARYPDLRGKVVLVTAGGAGIGRAIAERFCLEGALVHVCDVNDQALGELEAAAPGVNGHHADVASATAVAALFAKIGPSIDVLVNNAGIGGPRAPIEHIEADDWSRTLEVNLSGAFFCLREATRRMKPAGRGCVINISTSSVRTALPNRTAYIVSKAGLMGLTHNAARELGPAGIRVNAILPGYIDNPRGAAITAAIAAERGLPVERVREEALRFISMRTMIDPGEVAAMAVFLASDEARHVSGQFIGVDGHQEWEG